MNTQVQVIIVNYKTASLTIECVESLLAFTTPDVITIVDNSECDQEVKSLLTFFNINENSVHQENQWVRTINDITLELIVSSKNLGFGGGCNIGVFKTMFPQKYLWFLNSDCLLFNDALTPLLTILQKHNGFKLISSIIADPPTKKNFTELELNIQVSGVKNFLGLFFNTKSNSKIYSNDYLPSDFIYGASFLLSREDYIMVNGFDESYFMYLEETDLAFRIKKASRKECCFSSKSIVLHHKGSSRLDTNKQSLITNNYLKFIKKNYEGIQLFFGYIWYFLKILKNRFNKHEAYNIF